MSKTNDIQEDGLKMNNRLPFRVPANYFEEFPGRIQERLEEPAAVTRGLDRVRPRLAYAAMIAVLVVAGYLGMKFLSQNPANTLTADEIEQVIEYYAMDFDEVTLISALIESDPQLFTEERDAETDAIIEYLSEDYIDFSVFLIED